MKNLITYLKTLWSWVSGSQRKKIGVTLGEATIEYPFSTYSAPFGTCWQPSGKLHSVVRCAAMLVMLFTIGSGNVWGGNEVYKTALFGSSYNSTGVQNYTSTWYSTNSGFRVDITNGNNNNNGWSTVKFGRKNYASTGTIITNAAIDKKVTQVRLTIDAITAGNITSITLYKSTNGSTWTSVGTFAKSTGAKDVAIAAGDQATNLYYKIEFVCTSGSSNGLITISRVDYYIDGVTTTTVTLNKNTGSTNGTAEISVGESAYTSFTAAVPVSCKLCTGYWTSTSGGTKVLNPDGSFAAENVTGWITSGKWSKDATTATLYAQWRDEIYSVTLKDNNATLTQASCGASVTLPSRAGCSGYTFAGWTKSWTEEQDEWTTTAPIIIPAGSYTPTADENLYPVYTKEESGGGSTTKTYGWEASEPDASSWTIGSQPSQANSNAHTGSYAGFINTNHTYVTFNDKVKVTEFSFWLKRTSKNSNYNVYIETSTDGSTWSAAATYGMGDFGNGSYTQKTKTWDGSTAYYVRFHCYNTTAERYVDDVSITYTGGTTTYYISVPNCCTSYDITLSGSGSISGAGSFSADATSACEGATVTLSTNICSGYTVGAWDVYKTGTPATKITVTSNQFTMPAYGVTVALSTTAKVDHFKDAMHETSGYTGDGYAVSGCNQTVPNLSNTTPASECEGEHYKFVGWVDDAHVDSDGTLLTGYSIVSGGTTSWNATGTTYYAIWAKEL